MYKRVCNYGHQVKQREQESDLGLGRAQMGLTVAVNLQL